MTETIQVTLTSIICNIKYVEDIHYDRAIPNRHHGLDFLEMDY